MKSKACFRMLRRGSRRAFLANCFLATFCILTPAALAAQDTLTELPLPGPNVASQASVMNGSLSILNWAGFAGAVSFTFDDSQPSQIQHFSELQATYAPSHDRKRQPFAERSAIGEERPGILHRRAGRQESYPDPMIVR